MTMQAREEGGIAMGKNALFIFWTFWPRTFRTFCIEKLRRNDNPSVLGLGLMYIFCFSSDAFGGGSGVLSAFICIFAG